MKLLSRFHRGRHRVGDPVSDIAKRINSEYFGEYDPDGSAWQLTSDKQYFMFQGPIVIPELPCSHDHREIVYEIEDLYSNGMFGLPTSNMLYAKTTCTDCGKELFPDPETGVIVCDAKQEWHDTTAE